MNRATAALTAGQAVALGVVVVGCATAATITGHLPGSDLLAILTAVGGGTAGVVGAHVGASQVSAALGSPAQPAPAPPTSIPAPGVGATVPSPEARLNEVGGA